MNGQVQNLLLVRTLAQNIITVLTDIIGHARVFGNIVTKTGVWKLVFDEEIMDAIGVNTNKIYKV